MRHNKIALAMTGLGQKQTFAMQTGMSALHLIATTKADLSLASCAVQEAKSAKGQKWTFESLALAERKVRNT